MVDQDQIQNRMVEKPELDGLRASSVKPTWWERVGQPTLGRIRTRTGLTVILALTILLVIVVATLVLT